MKKLHKIFAAASMLLLLTTSLFADPPKKPADPSISIVEVPTAALIENCKISRNKAASIVSVVVFALAIPVTLSMGIMGNLKFFGLNLFDFFDYITSNILLPLNTIILCIVIGWFVKLRNIRAFRNKMVYAIFNFLLRFVTPVALTILILFGTILKR